MRTGSRYSNGCGEPSGKHVFRYRLLPPAEAGPKPIL